MVGDAPNLPTGLGRISRELAYLLHSRRDELGISVTQLGLGWDKSEHWPWPVIGVQDETEWANLDLPGAIQSTFRGRPGVVFSIWDPHRCFYVPRWVEAFTGARAWGYFPIDSAGRTGGFGGPAADCVRQYDRVLAYGPFGAKVLRETLGQPVQWLPHGIDLDFWRPVEGAQRKLIGCVAANQIRKDLASVFEAWALLKERHPGRWAFWLHTDLQVKAWSVPQLAEEHGFGDDLLVTLVGRTGIGDAELKGLYSQCVATVAPGLGEGFGYPIVESMACGAPAIHVNYGGGAELTPPQWRHEPAAFRLEGLYLQKRPVLDPEALAWRLEQAATWAEENGPEAVAYCRGAVAHLGWKEIDRRWFSWLKQGLQR
jgi:glycosyltransferase involved in cell wall biosynthesis